MNCVLYDFSGYYLVLPSFTGFFVGFYWVVPSFTGFDEALLILLGFYRVGAGLNRVLPSFPGFIWDIHRFLGFYWVLPGFIAFYRV